MPQADNVEMQQPTVWFSRSKTRAPRFSIALVERKRLLRALDEALNKPVSCIVAPAGFGKSTLLSQWRESLIARDVNCAWINLDGNDAEIRQFFAYLVFAFEDAGVLLGYLKQAAENGFVDMSSAAITTSLLSAIIDIEDHMVLVLDDYHRVDSPEIDKFVEILSDQCGDKLHIAIGSRTSVNINLPTLLAAGQAIEIPSANLRFSDREVEEAIGSELDQDTLDALQEQLEGWPVAVQMLRLSQSTTDHAKIASYAMASTHRHLAEYLVTNVLESQSQELKEFLLETSILDSFNAELANAVCGHRNAQSFIYQLQSLQALVVPLDDNAEWLRYHHLFSECLRKELKYREPEKYKELHRRAAKWCGENRMIAEAVNYANAIKDYRLSKQVINENRAWMRAIQFGGVGYLNGLFANIPENEITDDPLMLFSKAFAHMQVGEFRRAQHYNEAAEKVIERDGITPELLRERLGIGTGIKARLEIDATREGGWLIERLNQADTMAAASPPLKIICGLIRTALTVQKVKYGDFDLAREYAKNARLDLEQARNPITACYCQVSMGLVEAWTNSFDKARRFLRGASETAISFGGQNSNMRFVGETLSRSLDYWQTGDDYDGADRLETALINASDADGWYDVYAVGFDAIVHDACYRGNYERAKTLITRLEKCDERFGIERLHQFIDILKLNLFVACGSLGEAERIYDKINNWQSIDKKSVDDFGWYHWTMASYACGRYFSAIGEQETAAKYVKTGLDEVTSLNILLIQVRGELLMASILEKDGRNEEALAVLEDAIEGAAQINCARAFVTDVSGILLNKAVSSVLDKTEAAAVKEFAGRLAVSGTQSMFSAREIEVLQGLAEGQSNKEIARDLDLTDNTIKFHLRNIYRKLGVKKRVPAVEKARELGVLD